MRLIFATGNPDKMREVREILADLPVEIVSMKEAGIEIDIVEDGTTFEENALIKARAVNRASGELTLADDSGLVVDAMGGMPGIYSSRFMGEDTSYEIKNAYIISQVDGLEGQERSARFVCAIAAVFPDGHEETATGTVAGIIADEPAGCGGFGYDPIFYVPELGCTTAELSEDDKNAISHRGRGLRAIEPAIRAWMERQSE